MFHCDNVRLSSSLKLQLEEPFAIEVILYVHTSDKTLKESHCGDEQRLLLNACVSEREDI